MAASGRSLDIALYSRPRGSRRDLGRWRLAPLPRACRDARTLKDLFVQRGRTEATDVWALRDVSAEIGARRGSRPDRPERLRQDDAAARDRRDHQADRGRVRTEGRIGSLLELGAGFHLDFTGRENVFLNGAIQGLRRADIKARVRRDRRLRRARERDRPARAHVLVGDDDAARVRDRGVPRRGHPAPRRGLRRRRRGVPAEVLRADLRVQGAGRHDRLRLARRLGGRAPLRALRCFSTEGGSRSTARRERRSTRYRRALADDADPAERGVGLREWGSGEASIASASLVGQEGSDRLQFLSGEPFELRVSVAADGVPPPRLQLELRDDAGALVAGHAVDLRGLGWASGNGARDVRFRIGALPLADGRFHLRLGLTDEAGRARLPLARRRARVRRLSGG